MDSKWPDLLETMLSHFIQDFFWRDCRSVCIDGLLLGNWQAVAEFGRQFV
ncbi:hypothetical protein MWU49_14510 [Alcanivorax sp. S6407]|nr:hypothetical protein [Alcanivorax sp. S6407]MCK0154925.1 hypothetical protein [Alcanivorax sp. S6407]